MAGYCIFIGTLTAHQFTTAQKQELGQLIFNHLDFKHGQCMLQEFHFVIIHGTVCRVNQEDRYCTCMYIQELICRTVFSVLYSDVICKLESDYNGMIVMHDKLINFRFVLAFYYYLVLCLHNLGAALR